MCYIKNDGPTPVTGNVRVEKINLTDASVEIVFEHLLDLPAGPSVTEVYTHALEKTLPVSPCMWAGECAASLCSLDTPVG